jgi:hypothetical protein
MILLLLLALLQGDDAPSAKALDRINAVRKAAGLEPVTLDAKLSAGCAAHAAYLVKNAKHPSVQGLGAHNEDKSLPGYTPEGEKAGKSSDIHFVEPLAAVDGWMASLFHRVPLLHPHLKKVGIGSVAGGSWGHVTLVDVMSGREGGKAAAPVLWPPDKAVDIPLAFGGEIPDPIPDDKDRKAGYPITVSFVSGEPVKEATATLKADGKDVEFWISSPDKPADKRYQANTICLFAKDALKPGTTYSVTINAKVNGKAWTTSWSFTTLSGSRK